MDEEYIEAKNNLISYLFTFQYCQLKLSNLVAQILCYRISENRYYRTQ